MTHRTVSLRRTRRVARSELTRIMIVSARALTSSAASGRRASAARGRRVERERGMSARRSGVVVRADAGADLIRKANVLTDDLKAMKTTMPTIRRVVAGNRNDLKALSLYQDALEGKLPSEEDGLRKLEKTLEDLASYVEQKADEEQFWASREGKVTSSVVDNTNLSEEEKREVTGLVANVVTYGVQGAVWNALILLVGFVTLVAFVLPDK